MAASSSTFLSKTVDSLSKPDSTISAFSFPKTPTTHCQQSPSKPLRFPSSLTFTTTHTNNLKESSRALSAEFTTSSGSETFQGLCYVVKDNIDTDQIIPAEYLTFYPSNPEERRKFGSHALIGLPDDYPTRFVEPGEFESRYSIVVAGENFGCGSSREHAPVALGAAGVKAVVAESYSRLFFRNSVATGEVYPLESEVRICDECRTGDVVTVELAENILINHTTGKEYRLKPVGDAGPVIEAGGIFAYGRKSGMIPSMSC